MLASRRNVAFAFWMGGLCLGLQLVLMAHSLIATPCPRNKNHCKSSPYTKTPPGETQLGLLIVSSVCVVGWGYWILETPPSELPFFLQRLQDDLVHMTKHSMDAVKLLFCIGFLSLIVSKKLLWRWLPLPQKEMTGLPFWFLSKLAMLIVSSLMLGAIDFLLHHDFLVDGKKLHRFLRWSSIWHSRTVAALCIVFFGGLLGSTMLALGLSFRHTRSHLLVLSVCNIAAAIAGTLLALRDRYFQKDLEHVLSLRMSAAVPVAIAGLFTGMSLAHFLSTYQIKVKVD